VPLADGEAVLVEVETQAVVGKFRDLAEPPDAITVEFGACWTAKAAMVVAHAGGEANFTVVLQ